MPLPFHLKKIILALFVFCILTSKIYHLIVFISLLISWLRCLPLCGRVTLSFRKYLLKYLGIMIQPVCNLLSISSGNNIYAHLHIHRERETVTKQNVNSWEIWVEGIWEFLSAILATFKKLKFTFKDILLLGQTKFIWDP